MENESGDSIFINQQLGLFWYPNTTKRDLYWFIYFHAELRSVKSCDGKTTGVFFMYAFSVQISTWTHTEHYGYLYSQSDFVAMIVI